MLFPQVLHSVAKAEEPAVAPVPPASAAALLVLLVLPYLLVL